MRHFGSVYRTKLEVLKHNGQKYFNKNFFDSLFRPKNPHPLPPQKKEKEN